MSKKKITVALAFVVALNIIVLIFKMNKNDEWAPALSDAEARNVKDLGHGFRSIAKKSKHKRDFRLIGDLVSPRYWKKVLPIGESQSAAIKKLDRVLGAAKVASLNHDADYLDTIPTDYREYMENSKLRRQAALKHGQLMTLTGLLTEPQADFVVSRRLSAMQEYSIHNNTMQELLGIVTDAQKNKLTRVKQEYRRHTAPLFINSMDPQHDTNVNSDIEKHKKEYFASSTSLLTPSQRATWRRLTAKRQLPTTAPEMPVPGDIQRGRMESKELSAVFRVLAEQEDMLALSEEQKRLLDDLCSVTQLGLFWINATAADQPASKVEAGKNQDGGIVRNRAEFLKHAEQVALLGVLTEDQAEQVQAEITPGTI